MRLAQHSTPDEFARTRARSGTGVGSRPRRTGPAGASAAGGAVRVVGRQSHRYGTHLTDPGPVDVRDSLERRLDAQIEALFHDAHPEGCPTDLLEKQSFLRAHALLSLLDGKGARSGRPEIVVVEDHTNPLADGRPSLDWGADVDLPHEVLETLRPTAGVYAITVRNGVIIDAPGQLDLGRETRLANRAQRRAFNGLVRDVCGAGMLCPLQPHQVAPHHLVATRWPHGSRQSDSVVREPPPEGPPRRLDHRAGPEPRTRRSPCRTDKS